MKKLFPRKLATGDEVRVIAPSRSMGILGQETKDIANRRFQELGLNLSFGRYVDEIDDFSSSTVEHRLEDLHEAFSDTSVAAVVTVIGGHNSNQLLRNIDWEVIKRNPKIFCGYSDITALNNSIFARTGLVTYSGPHYSSFGQKLYFDFTLENFKNALFQESRLEIAPSEKWSDDAWYIDQDERDLEINTGWNVITAGKASGTVIGGNLSTLNLLQGTEYMPSLQNSVLFLEDDELTFPANFDRDLQSLIHQPDFLGVKGVVIGRFQKSSEMSLTLLHQIIHSKKELSGIPVIANVDFGHSDPKITIPIGGDVEIEATESKSSIVFVKH